MKSIAAAQTFSAAGRYKEALEVFPIENSAREAVSSRLLRAELLVNVGETSKALSTLTDIERGKALTDSERSHLEFIHSRVARERGAFDRESQHLQKSITFAERARDTERTCRAQLQLMALVADRSGPDSVGTLMSALRANVTALGDAGLTAALHVVIGELDGKRSFLSSALRHTQLAQRFLQSTNNLWLEAWAQINTVAISILQCEFDRALIEGESALRTSIESGSNWATRASLGNLGFLHLHRGEFEIALSYFDRVIAHTESSNEHMCGALDSMARVRLAQGQLQECIALVERVDESRESNGAGRYVHRYSLLTKSELLARLERWKESLTCINDVIDLARQSHDHVLVSAACLFKAEILLHHGHCDEAERLTLNAIPLSASQLPDVSARYERAIACLLAGTGRGSAGRRHFDRAQRIYKGLGNTPALIELSRSWDAAENLGLHASPADSSGDPGSKTRNLLQNVATWMLHAGRPELLATGLIAILADSESAAGAVAVARDPHGSEESLASFGTLTDSAQTSTIALGTSRNRAVEVRLQPLPDIESQVTLNSITMLLGTVRDLERANAEREERLTLWPLEELPFGDDDALIMGRMRELMTFARKVAQTNVTVLITGESGTGKEVLARAIHAYSQRAKKPFVPFNCTAIPRELLESQLFGYRRGAFTGAERDNPGIIRTARDGTLFLDEVGELGLDLQPKLLRFLESGEINPLGETSPLLIDVRIVAATNANLDHLVETGRFREDLFYRLNVIRLAIPPLRERRDEIPGLVHHFVAKAAREFKKGRIRVAEETMERIILYSWPGNVRQLQNELRRMVALADADSTLPPIGLSKPIRQETMHAARNPEGPELAVPLTDKLLPTITRVEREMIKVALRANQGHLESTAKALGISRKGLYLKRQRLGV